MKVGDRVEVVKDKTAGRVRERFLGKRGIVKCINEEVVDAQLDSGEAQWFWLGELAPIIVATVEGRITYENFASEVPMAFLHIDPVQLEAAGFHDGDRVRITIERRKGR